MPLTKIESGSSKALLVSILICAVQITLPVLFLPQEPIWVLLFVMYCFSCFIFNVFWLDKKLFVR